MAYASLVTLLRVDREQARKDMAAFRREMQAFHREMAALATIPIRATGGPGVAGAGAPAASPRLQTLGPGGVPGGARTSPAMREEVRDRLADFAQIRRLQRDRLTLEAQTGRDLRAMRRREEREREEMRARELAALRTDIQARDRLRVQAEQQRANQARAGNRAEERARDQRRARELRDLRESARAAQRMQEAEAAHLARFFGLPSRPQEAAARARAERDAAAAARRAEIQRRMDQRDAIRLGRTVPITGVGGRFGGGGGRPGGLGGPFSNFDDLYRRGHAALEDSFKRATRAAEQLSLVANVGILGGLGAIVAEGFRVNSQFEKLNITMAATLGITNDVVNAQGGIVTGAERTNFLLKGTAGFYDQIREIAAKTIIEQQELIEITGENLALAQQAGFPLKRLTPEETRPVIQTFANVGSLARAIGLPGGTRQLSQEIRALLLGERLQGATIARLLGFTDVEEIKRLQNEPGEGGQSKFVEELGKRFQAVQPILDRFEKSAAGIFTALISQAREFLRIATESAFQKVTEVLGRTRDFLSNDRVAASAQRVGEALGNVVAGIIRFGQSPFAQLLFKLLSFMVNNASTLIAVFGAFKALQFVQNIGRPFGGPGGLVGFLGGGGAGAAGAALGAGVGRGAGFVSPARGAAIEFASAAGQFGLGAAATRFAGQAQARAGLGAILGRPAARQAAAAAAAGLAGIPGATGGIVAGVAGRGLLERLALSGPGRAVGALGGAGALLGLSPATIVAGTALGSLGIGTALDRFVLDPQIAPTRAPGFGERSTDVGRSAAQSIAAIQASRAAARRRALDLATRGAEAREGGGGPDAGLPTLRDIRTRPQSVLADVLSGALLARIAGAFTSGARPAPALTEKVTAAKQLLAAGEFTQRDAAGRVIRRATGAAARIEELREAGSRLSLEQQRNREREDEAKKERLQALLSLAEVRRQREAAIKIQAELDARAARKEIGDATALANTLKAIRMRRNRDLRELREDEASEVKELQARALNDEEAAARLRMEREKREATRRIRDRRILAATLAAIDLQGQRDILEGRLANIGRRSAGRSRLAEARGQVFTGIVEQGRQELVEIARLRTQNLINDREFQQGRQAVEEATNKRLLDKRREFFDRSIDLSLKWTDTLRESTRLQEDYELSLLQMRERVRDRERALNQARLAEVNQLVDAQQELREAREALADLNEDQGLRAAAFDAFRMAQTGPGGFALGGIESRVAGALSRRGQAAGEFAGLSREQREAAVQEQTRQFLSGLFDALTGEGGLAAARAKLGEIGVSPTRAEAAALVELPGRAAATRRRREERELLGQRVEAEGAVAGAEGAIAEAREQRRRTEEEDLRARRQENVERRRLTEDFDAAVIRSAVELSRARQEIIDFAGEVRKAGVTLSRWISGVFQNARTANVPTPEVATARSAAQAVAADQRAAARRAPAPTLDSHVGVATVVGAAGAVRAGGGQTSLDNRRSEGATIINLNGLQLGPDTRALFEQLAEKLKKEARVTAVG